MVNNLQNTVNSNEGINNIIGSNEIRTTMIDTFLELANMLKGHCGPYSGTAILTDPNNPMAEPVFTKDGINIVSSIKYANVMQDFVRTQLAYMGTRIESGAGDGTTSAMIVMAYAIATMLKKLEKSKYRYTSDDLSQVWKMLVDNVTVKYKWRNGDVTKITDRDMIRHVAASQAYTSSHGDVELAECVGAMFANTPREVWDTLMVQKASYESEEKYRVDIKDAQYTIDDVTIFPVNRRNKELDAVLRMDNANCLTRTFMTLDDENQKFVHDYIEQCIKDGTQLNVITCNDLDTNTINHYSGLFSEYPDHHVLFFLVRYEDGALNDINAIDMIRMQSIGPLDMTKLNLFTADLECEGSVLRFKSGLFVENPYDPTQNPVYGLNPYYKSKDYPIFNKYVDQIKQIIEKEKADVSRRNSKAIAKFTRILHKLIATKDVTFTVGGAAYDNAAGQDIAMDALLAAKCSLTQGFVSGGFKTLKEVLEKIQKELIAFAVNNGQKKAELLKIYLDSLLYGITQVNQAIVSSLSKNARKRIKGHEFAPFNVLRLDDPSYAVPKDFVTAKANQKEFCVIQPAMTDITFMKRFGEVGLKFLTANRVITSGYYYVNKEK